VTLPIFSVRDNTITHENPTVITDGIMVCQEAFIEIDTASMSQTFVHLLMHHMGEGNIRVKMARLKEQKPVQVSPLQFVEMVMEKEHLVGKPIFWAE
jgi:hypothetical protein